MTPATVHKKKNVAVTIGTALVGRMRAAIDTGAFSSYSDVVQTIVSEYVGQADACREAFPENADILLKKPIGGESVRLTLSLNRHVSDKLSAFSEQYHATVSETLSAILLRHFMPDALSEIPLGGRPKSERFIEIRRADLDAFVLGRVRDALKRNGHRMRKTL